MKRLTSIVVTAVMLLAASCGRESGKPDITLKAGATPTRVTQPRDFTQTEHLRPAARDVQPSVSGDEAYEAVVASTILPFTNGQPALADELLLGLFTDDQRGPANTLAWAVVFHDAEIPLDGPAGRTGAETVTQDLLVVVDAISGRVIRAIGGVN